MLVTPIEDVVGVGAQAKKKRDTFVVSRWRGEGRAIVTRPALSQARVRAIERIAGETIRAVRAMTTAKTTEATEATCRAAKTPRAARATMRATSTEARGGGLGHGGGGFSLDDVVHGVLLVSVFARMREARPARQRVCGPVGPCRRVGDGIKKRGLTRGRPLGAAPILRGFHRSVYTAQALVRHGTSIVKAC